MSAPPPREISPSALPGALEKDKDETGRIFLAQQVILKLKHQNEQTGFAVQITVSRCKAFVTH